MRPAQKRERPDYGDLEQLVLAVTQRVTTIYGELVNEVGRGEKPTSVLKNMVRKVVMDEGYTIAGVTSMEKVVEEVMNSILGYGVLQPLLDKPGVTDIFVNGPQNVYQRLRDEDMFVPEIKWRDNEALEQYIRSVLVKCGQKIHSGTPLVDARDVKNHLRINAGISPVAKTPYLAIRKHTVYNFTLNDFLRSNTFNPEVLEFLKQAVTARLNILIAGPTGSGKTTLLRFLAQEFIPPEQRIVVLEEEEELVIKHPNQVALEAKKKSGEDDTGVEMDDLVRNALRMAMRRIILGELRGKEAFTLLRAFGTGHDGGLVTVHANDGFNAIEQLAVMMLYANTPLNFNQLKRVIAQSLDLMIYMENFRVVEVTAIEELDERTGQVLLSPVFASERREDGELVCKKIGVSSKLKQLCWRRGVKLA